MNYSVHKGAFSWFKKAAKPSESYYGTVQPYPYLGSIRTFSNCRSSLAGRSQSRRFLLGLLSPRQRFCLNFLGRYTIRGNRGTLYKIEINRDSGHQWFYIHKPPDHRYYFSLITNGRDRGKSTQDDIYRNLTAIHMALLTDELSALETANWEYSTDKIKWARKHQFPPRVTFLKQQRGKFSSYVDYFQEYLGPYFG